MRLGPRDVYQGDERCGFSGDGVRYTEGYRMYRPQDDEKWYNIRFDDLGTPMTGCD